jgi:zinc and cadmium transporter
MRPLGWILLATVGIGLTAWVGVLALFFRDQLLERLLPTLAALAAGSLLGGAFLHGSRRPPGRCFISSSFSPACS